MARKTDSDFNTRVHDVFEKIGRGELSPHRVSRKELVKALQAVEQSRTTESSDKPAD